MDLSSEEMGDEGELELLDHAPIVIFTNKPNKVTHYNTIGIFTNKQNKVIHYNTL